MIARLSGAVRQPLALTLLLVVVCGGCGGGDANRGAVQGRVTLDGQPIETGEITFFPTDGNQGPVAGGRIRDGNYSIAAPMGPAIGPNRVEISANKMTGKQLPGPGGKLIDQSVEAVPAQYNTDSQLIQEVMQGKNQIDFELTSAASQQ